MSRIRTYLGPEIQVTPDEIERYERQGCWLADEKKDGAWAEVSTNDKGIITSILSRVGKTFVPCEVEGILGLSVTLPNTTFATELEAKSEYATKIHQSLGYRRIHVFDIVKLMGQPTTELPVEKRRELVELVVGKLASRSIQTVRQTQKGFRDFYKEVMADGGEGLVFKKKGSLYRPTNSDGKVNIWHRCKPERFVDYIVMRVGKSDGGQDNLKVGLYINGKLTEVCTIKNCPTKLDLHALVGRVIECKGFEVFDSGALRSGHYYRTRDDKPTEDCTLESALAVNGRIAA